LIERSFWDDESIREGALYRQERKWCNEHASGIMTTPREGHEAFFLASLACERLRDIAASGDGQPWSLRLDFWAPHQPYFPTREFADMYDPTAIPEYGNFHDTLETKPEVYRTERNAAIGRDGRIVLPSLLPWSVWQEVLARSYAQTTLVDAAGGMVLDTLDELGLAEDTLVIWTTDHGDAVACHGGHFDKSSYMPEEMVRIPMAMRLPGRIPAGQTSDALVSNLDLPPTFLDAAGTAFAEEVDGASLLPLASGESDEWRDEVVSESHGHGEPVVGRLIVAGSLKYVANRGQMDELYDLEADPYELTNLIDDPTRAADLAGMRARLKAWQERTGDPECVD
jgi:arylsulfatase A-like enzyme